MDAVISLAADPRPLQGLVVGNHAAANPGEHRVGLLRTFSGTIPGCGRTCQRFTG